MDYQEQITHLIPKLTELFPMIEVLYLFGSRASKTNKADSDIDLAVFVNKQHDPHDPLLDLKIGVFFYEHLKKKTDIVIMNDANPIIQNKVLKNGIILFEKNSENRAKYELASFKKYIDHIYYQQKRWEKYKQDVQSTNSSSLNK